MSFTIRKKGLIIVAVPLLIQSFFIVMLLLELDRAEADTKREMLARELVSTVDKLLVDAYGATGALYRLSMVDSDEYGRIFSRNIRMVESDLSRVGVLSKKLFRGDNREFSEKSNEIKIVIDRLKMVRKNQKNISSHREMRNEDKLMGYMFVDNFLRATAQLAELEHSRLDRELGKSQSSRDTVKTLVYYGLAANVIAAFAIAIFFVKNIENKIVRILSNIDSFSRKESLIPPDKIDDELSQVDNAFFDMANELKEAQTVKQNFIAMMGHDIRTPLTSIKGVFDMLRDGESISGDEDMQSLVEGGYGEAGRLISLTSNLLDVQALESGHFSINTSPCNLVELVDQAIISLSSQTRAKKIEIVNHVPENLTAYIDRNRIIQVLINLLTNALNHSPDNCRITVTGKEQGSFIEIEVADNGKGISDQEKEEIFQTYFHSESSHSMSLGLGLSICKAIVEAHGGEIAVRDHKPSGAVFYFTVPAGHSNENGD